MRRIDTFNWRNDAVNPYESIIGVQQRFCALNRVPLMEFFKFATEVGALSPRETPKAWIAGLDLSRINMQRLGYVLCEPKQLLSSSELTHFCPILNNEVILPYDKFRYCPACIRRGYHSAAHQVPWFDRCLLDGSILEDRCPSCHCSFFVEGSHHLPISEFRCKRCGFQLWPGFNDRSWPNPLTMQAVEPITEYLRWVQKWRTHPYTRAIANDWKWRNDVYTDCVNALKDLIPRPKGTEVVWTKRVAPELHKTYLKIGKSKRNAILEAFCKFGHHALLDFFVQGWSDLDGDVDFRPLTKSLIRHVRRKHTQCRRLMQDVTKLWRYDNRFYRRLAKTMCVACKAVSEFPGASKVIEELREPIVTFRDAATVSKRLTDASRDYADIRDWLIDAGLLRARESPKLTILRERRGESRETTGAPSRVRWVIDDELRLVVNHLVKQKLTFWHEWLLGHYAKAEHIHACEERAEAFQTLDRDAHLVRSISMFALPVSARGGLTIMTWTNSAWPRHRRGFNQDELHVREVKLLAIAMRAVILEDIETFESRLHEAWKSVTSFRDHGGGSSS